MPYKVLFFLTIKKWLQTNLFHYYIEATHLTNKQKELITAMKRCVPFFRKILSKELNIKVIPQLFFKIETQFDRIEEVEQWFKDI